MAINWHTLDSRRSDARRPTARSGTAAYGVDGCRSGWFCFGVMPSGKRRFAVAETMKELVDDAGDSARIFVDIPIGLTHRCGGRRCDAEARRNLKAPRASSVFSPPVRQALSGSTYEQASATNRTESGKGLTRQAYAIIPKITQVDNLLQEDETAKRIVREVHPEICFWALAEGNAMEHGKKTSAGFRERLNLLERLIPSARQDFQHVRLRFRSWDLADDDILDAIAAAITASANPAALATLPEDPPDDCFDLPMEMVYTKETWPKT